jgi:hypothetical protein
VISSTSPVGGGSASAAADVEECIRARLAEWQQAGAMQTPAEQTDVINSLAASAEMAPDKVRFLWLASARRTRPTLGPAAAYVRLAEKHHGVKVEVVDLGQYSAERSNSCMFLTCAASIADRRLQGYDDCWGLGVLKDSLERSAHWDQTTSITDLVAGHKRDRSGTIGRMAEALRHSACEDLLFDEDFYLPFFHPRAVRGGDGGEASSSAESFRSWVAKMRGSEEGDELVILALARLLGIAVQPVQQSGYHVPLMDPTESASSGCIMYWGNDDTHWVWLQPVS